MKQALTDSKAKRPRIQDRSAEKKDRWYSDKQKVELVKSYMITGNLALAARMLNISEVTARKWKVTQWWKDLEQEIKDSDRIQLSNQLQEIIGKALKVVEDRIQNGDYFYDQKTGEVVRKPVNMREANKVAVDLLNHKDKVNSQAKMATMTEDSLESKLIKIAEKFADLANKAKEKKED